MNSQPLTYGIPTGNDPIGFKTTRFEDTTRYKFIRVSNQERSTGTPSAFSVNLGNDPVLDRCVMLEPVSVSIPNLSYIISAAKGNNRFHILFLPATDASFTVPDGNYSTANLIALINLIVPPSGTLVASQNAATGLITITATTSPFVLLGSSTFPNTSGMNSYLGFTSPSPPGGTLVWTADSIPSLQGDTVFYLHSPTLSLNMTYLDTFASQGQLFDVNSFLMIPISVPHGTYQTYEGQEHDKIVFGRKGRSIRNFDIVLRANHGRLLDLTENQEFVITFKMFYDGNAR